MQKKRDRCVGISRFPVGHGGTQNISLGAIQHHKGLSFFQLLEYGLENDLLEAIERGRTAFDLHTENCALPGSQEEFGEIHRIER